MSTAIFQIYRDDLPSPVPRKAQPVGDGDSGYDELIDDAAAFEFTPPVSHLSPSPLAAAAGSHASQQLHILREQQQQQQYVARSRGGGVYPYRSRSNEVVSSTADSAYSTSTPEYSPVSPSPRALRGFSVSTQPDGAETVSENGRSNGSPDGRREESTGNSPLSPSPAGSEEDVSEKGEKASASIYLENRAETSRAIV